MKGERKAVTRKCVKHRKRGPTAEDRLAVSCKRCGAVAGRKCSNYLGKPKAFCPSRGLPEELTGGNVYEQGELNFDRSNNGS